MTLDAQYAKWNSFNFDEDDDDDEENAARMIKARNALNATKVRADDLFRNKQYERAITLYDEILNKLPSVYGKGQKDLQKQCLLNIAAGFVAMETYKSVVDTCNVALTECSSDIYEAFKFRGYAKYQLGKLDDAQKDLETAKKLMPPSEPDTDVLANLATLRNAMECREKAKALLPHCLLKFREGKWKEAVESCRNALNFAEQSKDTALVSIAHGNLATCYYKTGALESNPKSAIRHFGASFKSMSAEDMSKRGVEVINGLASCYSQVKQHDKAKEWYLKLLTLCDKYEKKQAIPLALLNLGCVELSLENESTAVEYLIKANEMAREQRNFSVLASSQEWMSKLYIAKQDTDRAMYILEAVSGELLEAGEMALQCRVLLKLVYTIRGTGTIDRFTSKLRDILAIFRKNSHSEGALLTTFTLTEVGDCTESQTDSSELEKLFEDAMAIEEMERQNLSTNAQSWFVLISIRYSDFLLLRVGGEKSKPLSVLCRARDVCKQFGFLVEQLHIVERLADLEEDFDEKSCHYTEGINLVKKLRMNVALKGKKHERAQFDKQLASLFTKHAQVHGKMGHMEEARDALKEAKSVYESLSDDCGVSDSLQALGTIYLTRGRKLEAKNCFLEALDIAMKRGDEQTADRLKGFVRNLVQDLRADTTESTNVLTTNKNAQRSICSPADERWPSSTLELAKHVLFVSLIIAAIAILYKNYYSSKFD